MRDRIPNNKQSYTNKLPMLGRLCILCSTIVTTLGGAPFIKSILNQGTTSYFFQTSQPTLSIVVDPGTAHILIPRGHDLAHGNLELHPLAETIAPKITISTTDRFVRVQRTMPNRTYPDIEYNINDIAEQQFMIIIKCDMSIDLLPIKLNHNR